jgi:hypothetical protein
MAVRPPSGCFEFKNRGRICRAVRRPRSSGMGRRSTDAAGEEMWVIEAAWPVLPTRLGNSLGLDGVGSSRMSTAKGTSDE